MEDLPKGASGLLFKGPKYIRTAFYLYTEADDFAQKVEHRNWEGIQSPWAFATTSLVAIAALLILFGEKVDVSSSAGSAIVKDAISDPSLLLAWVGFALLLQLVATKSFSLANTVTAAYAYLYGLGTSAVAVCLIVLSLKFSSQFGSPPDAFPMLLFALALGPVMVWSFFAVPTLILARIYQASNELAFGLLIAYCGIIFYFSRGGA